ncbi:hypothetical protein HWV62_17613 [Athelia sp. TMB]|nr:hypothetical protein HWV62_17613 [Athelia sp. TMB]
MYVQISMELNRSQREQTQMQERDREEMRTLLQNIAHSVEELRAIQQVASPVALELMESIEEELDDPRLGTTQTTNLQDNLAVIRERATVLPQTADLTGHIERIGEYPVAIGTFNDIWKGIWASQTEKFEKEVDIWRRLTHPNVVRLYGVAYFGSRAYMVSHWMAHGSAITYVKSHPNADKLRILNEVAAGLEYLHASNVIHGDLRGANVLITARHKACLSDFGFSKILEEFGQGNSSATGSANCRWTAPEVINPSLVGQSKVCLSMRTDVWSFGMLCIELLTGLPPFSHIAQDITVAINVSGGQLPPRPMNCKAITDNIWALILRCCDIQPKKRPSISAVKLEIQKLREDPTVSSDNILKSPLTNSPLSIAEELAPEPPRKIPVVKIRTSYASSTSSSESSKVERRPSSASSLMGRLNPFGHPRSPSGLTPLSPSSPKAPPPIRRDPVPEISISLPNDYGSRFSLASSNTARSDPGRDSIFSVVEQTYDPNIFRSVDGSIEAATLDALIGELISLSSDVQRSVEYRDVFLSTCVAFTTNEEVFSRLLRRFEDAESSPGQERTLMRISIVTLMKYWVACVHTRIDRETIDDILEFAMSLVSARGTSSRMKELAKELMMASGQTTSPKAAPPSNGRELAIGLMLIEGDYFSRILPSDCIYHLRNQPENHIRAASDLNNKLVYWGRRPYVTILHTPVLIFLSFVS